MADQTFDGLARTNEGDSRTSEGLSRNHSAGISAFEDIRYALEIARALAWDALGSGHPTAEEVHKYVSDALETVNAKLFRVARCAGPDCLETVPDKGFGRPARYCSPRCKDRAAYARKRQRKG
ncbi:CGNR zinc finger domain-containing protein [Streptomyces sp. NPDC051310]|uniref:CGNR zinc finger domain-containing protein n=1 Tax=Streptomyces sp. NPDC051310 TaxID=3365649 RepID=UPI0037A3C70F